MIHSVLLNLLHHVLLLPSCNFRLPPRSTVLWAGLGRKKKRKVKETRAAGSRSIDRWVCSLVEWTFYSFPRETFAVKPFPFACAFSNIPFLIRPVLFPHSSSCLPTLAILPSSIFRLRASTTPLPRFHFASYRLPPFLPKPKDSPFLSRPADTTNRWRWGKEIAGKASSFSWLIELSVHQRERYGKENDSGTRGMSWRANHCYLSLRSPYVFSLARLYKHLSWGRAKLFAVSINVPFLQPVTWLLGCP